MEGITQSHGVQSTPHMNCKELIASSLHVVNCDSMDELILMLYSLRTFLKNHPEVCALFIDSIRLRALLVMVYSRGGLQHWLN